MTNYFLHPSYVSKNLSLHFEDLLLFIYYFYNWDRSIFSILLSFSNVVRTSSIIDLSLYSITPYHIFYHLMMGFIFLKDLRV